MAQLKDGTTIGGNTALHTGNFTDSSANWNTAYGWGNHASAGYISTTAANAAYQAAGNYFTDGDTVLNMTNNDGLVYDDATNKMYVKLDGTNREIYHTGNFTDSSSNWNTAYTDRNKWDGGSTGLTAATGRTSLGLGTAATAATGDFATAAQGVSATTAEGWGDHAAAGYAQGAFLPLGGGTLTGNLTLQSNLVITETSPTISLLDTDSEDDFYIHVNSNNFYVLRNTNNTENTVDGGWDTPHPIQLEGDTNNAYIFGNLIGTAAYASTSAFATSAQGTLAATAYGWGDHGAAGYASEVWVGEQNYASDAAISTAIGTVTLSSLGYTGATNANYITNTNQLTNGAGYLNSSNDRTYITDSRGSQRAPSYYNDRYAQWDFQNKSDTLAGGDTWHGILTVSKWSVYDSSHRQEQIFFTGDDLKRRTATSETAWGSVKTIWDSGNLTNNQSEWDTAYGWGNHASAGYLTTYTDTNTQLSEAEVRASFTGGTNVSITNGVISATDTNTVYSHPTSAGNKHIPTGGSAGQFLKYSASGTATWATPSYTTNTNTQLSETEVRASFTGGTNVSITNGVITATDTDTVYTHPTSAGNKHVPTGGSAGQFLKYSASGTATWATPSYTTNTDTNTTYTGGTGMTLNGTVFNCDITSPADVALGNLSSSGNALAGSFTATGDITAFSDARVKENVETLPNALESVKQMRGVVYNKIGADTRSVGVIAQELEEVVPQLVHTDEEGMKSVAYGNITAVLIEAIKEQQVQIEELKAKLDGLTK